MTEPLDPSQNDPSPNKPTQNATPSDAVVFGASSAQREPRNWTPLIVGFVLVLAVVAVIAFLGRGKKDVVKTADPYAPKLVVEQAKLSQADNFVGATVTYIDLTVKNDGERTVVGGAVQAVFRDTLGQAVQTETLAAARADSSSAGRRGRGGRSGAGAAGAGARRARYG